MDSISPTFIGSAQQLEGVCMRICFRSLLLVGSCALVMTFFLACGGGGGSGSAPNTIPAFSTQPMSQTIYSGGTAIFTVAANGNPAPTLTWERSNDTGTTWTPISGATSSTYSFTVQPTDSGDQFRATAANSSASVNSLTATLTEVPAVYAGGRIDVTNPTPGYWINGTWVQLSTFRGQVNSFVVSGSNIFAAGYSNNMSGLAPGYWKNGTWIGLPATTYAGQLSGSINSLFVSGT